MKTINQKDIPFTVDHVGSFLRPERLKIARKGFTSGDITKEQLRVVEDEEIEKLVEQKKE